LVNVLGFDIGGANTKAVYLQENNGQVTVQVASQYFPIWKNPQKLSDVLRALAETLVTAGLDALGVTMTAELSDAYRTKREGVCSILSCVNHVFSRTPCYFLSSSGKLVTSEEARSKPLEVASANWAATGWLISQYLKDAVIVDVGSTSTSIIPIVQGQVAAKGKTDLEKLVCGELVYTGSLRTNIATITHTVPIRGGVASVSSELFSTSGDVHLLLGNISAADFTSETADGREKSFAQAQARLSRVVCADTEMLTQSEITDLAKYVWERQINQISDGLRKVYNYTKNLSQKEVPIVVTGLGKDFLAQKAAEKIGAAKIVDMEAFLNSQAVLATPALGVTLMTAGKIKGVLIKWP
jgi:probable H4MPT-linked C1 transfer pathway protein